MHCTVLYSAVHQWCGTQFLVLPFYFLSSSLVFLSLFLVVGLPGVYQVYENEFLMEPFRLMLEHDLSGVPVVSRAGAGDTLVANVSASDILQLLHAPQLFETSKDPRYLVAQYCTCICILYGTVLYCIQSGSASDILQLLHAPQLFESAKDPRYTMIQYGTVQTYVCSVLYCKALLQYSTVLCKKHVQSFPSPCPLRSTLTVKDLVGICRAHYSTVL